MTTPTNDAVSAYLAVLRGVGLSESEIRRLHSTGHTGDDPLDRVIADAVEATTEREWHDQLVTTLCRSPQGLELPRFYKSRAAANAITAIAGAHGYEATVEPQEGREFAVELTDELTGETDRVLIGYPDTELGADNLPALLAAIEQVRFAADGLTIALLSTTGRWQAMLVERSAIDGLTEQFGEGIEPFGRPVLAEATPVEFAVDPPIPGQAPERTLEDPSDVDLDTWLANATEESTEEVIEALEQSGTKRVVAENKSDDVLATIEETAEKRPDDTPEASADTATDDSDRGRTLTDDEPIETETSESTAVDPVSASDVAEPAGETTESTSVHAPAELSADGFSTTDDDESSAETTTVDEELNSIGGGPTKTVSTDGIDEVFEKLEEQALDPDELAVPVKRADTELPSLDATGSDDEKEEEFGSLSGGGPKRSVSSTSADDILSSVEDTGFESFRDDESADHVETDPESLLDDTDTTDSEMLADDDEPADSGLEPASDEMDGFVGGELVGDGATSTRSSQEQASDDDVEGSLDEIEGLADRVAQRLSDNRPDEESKDWTDAIRDSNEHTGTDNSSAEETAADVAERTPEERDDEDAMQQFRFPGQEKNGESQRTGDNGFALPDDEFEITTDDEPAERANSTSDE